MNRPKKLKVLIVEDSLVFQEVLKRGLSSDPQLEVVGTASDPFEARDMIVEYEPDVMTCDVQMPKMNGIEFLRRLLPQYPLPVIVVSSLSDSVFDAMSAGAVDFVGKPDMRSPQSVKQFIENIIIKIKIAETAKVLRSMENYKVQEISAQSYASDEKVIAIGASTGGTEAIFNILRHFPSNAPGVVIAQHIPEGFSRMFAERLHRGTALNSKEAKNGDVLERGTVLIAPGDMQMRLKKIAGKYRVECWAGEKVSGHRPSVDVLFESVAKVASKNAIGVILTGMGYDGAKGLLAMKRRGAKTIGQDEKTSVVYGMPKVAFELGAVDKQLPLDRIPQGIHKMLTEG